MGDPKKLQKGTSKNRVIFNIFIINLEKNSLALLIIHINTSFFILLSFYQSNTNTLFRVSTSSI
jgi:hypothetical protein